MVGVVNAFVRFGTTIYPLGNYLQCCIRDSQRMEKEITPPHLVSGMIRGRRQDFRSPRECNLEMSRVRILGLEVGWRGFGM